MPRLCSPLRLAEGLREVVLELGGKAAYAVPDRIAALSCLTQLDSLQLRGLALDMRYEHLITAVSPLFQLKQLGLRFIRYPHTEMSEDESDEDGWDDAEDFILFPWKKVVCGLIRLQDLRVCSDSDNHYRDMLFGALPSALSRLTALQHFEVLGMGEGGVRSQLALAAMPALQTAALRLHTTSGQFPGLCPRQHVVLSRLVSLSLALRVYDGHDGVHDITELPTISAPFLTELILDGIMLAPDSEQLSWLPGLPKLRRLVLTGLKTAGSELPAGVVACSSLTELVLKGILVNFQNKRLYWPDIHAREKFLCDLPAAGPYLSRLVRLSLSQNSFTAVPPSLAAATALVELDLGWQNLLRCQTSVDGLQGLQVLNDLTRLRCVNMDSKDTGAALQRLRAARPDVRVTLQV